MLQAFPFARSFRCIDLSLPLNPATPSPVAPGVEQRLVRRYEDATEEGAPHYKMTWFGMNDHCGTHMDAPAHFLPGGADIDEVDIASLCLMPAVRLDLTPGSPYQKIDAPAIRSGIARSLGQTPLPPQVLLLLHTGHYRFAGQPEYWESPFLTPDACRLLAELQCRAVGINGPTVDDRREVERPAHTLLLSAGLAVIEGVCATEELPDGIFYATALPLRLSGATGSPVRLVAFIA